MAPRRGPESEREMANRNATPKADPFDAAVACLDCVRNLLAAGRYAESSVSAEAAATRYAEAEQYALAARGHVASIVSKCRKATLPARKAKDAERKAAIASEPVTCDRCDKSFTRAEMTMYCGCLHCPDCDKALRKLDAENATWAEGYNKDEGY